MSVQGFTSAVLERIQGVLKPIGYRKRGNTFLAERNDVLLLVQLQKSHKTTRDTLIATLNLGVFSPALSQKLGLVDERPTIPDCHWRQRIGDLLPEQSDKWWEIHSEEEAIAAGNEIAGLLERYGIPALEEVSSSAKLRTLWLSGQSPGLTEHQCQRYLGALDE